ncbi:MAG: hypothetical protein HY827_06165 [Actinobacteria bacterium]|nr:hypothetical protein [Actinomycetota bacterium]
MSLPAPRSDALAPERSDHPLFKPLGLSGRPAWRTCLIGVAYTTQDGFGDIRDGRTVAVVLEDLTDRTALNGQIEVDKDLMPAEEKRRETTHV